MEWISLVVSVGISVAGATIATVLSMGKYKEKVDQLEKTVSGTNKKIEKLQEKTNERLESLHVEIAAMGANLVALEKNIDSLTKVAQSHSPLSLTPKGKKLVKDSGFMGIFEEIKDELVKAVEKKKPYSQYDVQEKSRAVLSHDMAKDPRFRQIEDWAYENGEDFFQILRAGAIPLRDYYFEKHPEIVDPKEKY